MRRLLVVSMLVVASVFVVQPPAFACSCVGGTIEERAARRRGRGLHRTVTSFTRPQQRRAVDRDLRRRDGLQGRRRRRGQRRQPQPGERLRTGDGGRHPLDGPADQAEEAALSTSLCSGSASPPASEEELGLGSGHAPAQSDVSGEASGYAWWVYPALTSSGSVAGCDHPPPQASRGLSVSPRLLRVGGRRYVGAVPSAR